MQRAPEKGYRILQFSGCFSSHMYLYVIDVVRNAGNHIEPNRLYPKEQEFAVFRLLLTSIYIYVCMYVSDVVRNGGN
jgi:hypothetical protein